MGTVLILSIIGFIVLKLDCDCGPCGSLHWGDELVFGEEGGLTWAGVGMFGYVLLGLGAVATLLASVMDVPLAITRLLAVIAMIVTVRLIIKSIQIDRLCGRCALCWILNVAILVAAFRY